MKFYLTASSMRRLSDQEHKQIVRQRMQEQALKNYIEYLKKNK